jgi:hypothetical protein
MSPTFLAGGDGMHQAGQAQMRVRHLLELGGDSPRRLGQPNWTNPARESSLVIACVS